MSVVQRRGASEWAAPQGSAVSAEPLRGLAFFVLLLPLLPSLMIAGGAVAGTLAGCPRDGAEACRIGAIDLGEMMRSALDAAWAMPVFVGLPMLIATVLIHRSAEDFATRLTWGAVLPGLTMLLVLALPVVAVHFADHESCRISPTGRGLCRVFGVEWGDSYSTVAVVPWLLIPAVPAAVVYGLCYLGFVRVSAWASQRPGLSRGAASSPGSSRSARA